MVLTEHLLENPHVHYSFENFSKKLAFAIRKLRLSVKAEMGNRATECEEYEKLGWECGESRLECSKCW